MFFVYSPFCQISNSITTVWISDIAISHFLQKVVQTCRSRTSECVEMGAVWIPRDLPHLKTKRRNKTKRQSAVAIKQKMFPSSIHHCESILPNAFQCFQFIEYKNPKQRKYDGLVITKTIYCIFMIIHRVSLQWNQFHQPFTGVTTKVTGIATGARMYWAVLSRDTS